MAPTLRLAEDGIVPLKHFPLREESAVSQEVVLIASVVLGVILVPSLITVRPTYYAIEEENAQPSPSIGSQIAGQTAE
jgi:hypothetical protein